MDNFDFGDWIETEPGMFYKKIEGERRRAKVFKQGFLVYEAQSNSTYDYRIDNIKLNEARVAEDRFDVQTGIGKIQAKMGEEEVLTIIKNKELDIGHFFKSDSLGTPWTNLAKDISKNITGSTGYQLKEALEKNVDKNRGLLERRLMHRGWVMISDSDACNIQDVHGTDENIYYQTGESGHEKLWDIDKDNDCIYLWKGTEDEETEAVEEACEYLRAVEYVSEHGFENKADVAIHFLRLINEQ